MQTLQISLRNLDAFSWVGFFSGAVIDGDLDNGYGGVLKARETAVFGKRTSV